VIAAAPEKLKFVDLFAGCGGVSLGLEMAGWQPVFVNELNQDALNTYLINRTEEYPYLADPRFHINDIRELTNNPERLSQLKEDLWRVHGVNTHMPYGQFFDQALDLLVGGPPCQGFSGIGHRRSYAVDREELPSNHLYKDMIYMIETLRPKIFMFENVENILRGRWTKEGNIGDIWNDVYKAFCGIDGYEVRYELIHAKEYGVPQNRPRVLLVGVREELNIPIHNELVAGGLLPNPTGGAPDLYDILDDLVDPNYTNGGSTDSYPHESASTYQDWYRTDRNGRVAGKGDPITEQEYSKHTPHVVAKYSHMITHNGEIPEEFKTKKFSQRLLPYRWGEKGPNITVASLAEDYVHFEQPRALTVREWARLQTFPDWYQFTGKRTTGGIRRAGNPQKGIYDREVPKYTQIGNAIPVRLAMILGEHFENLLAGNSPSMLQKDYSSLLKAVN